MEERTCDANIEATSARDKGAPPVLSPCILSGRGRQMHALHDFLIALAFVVLVVSPAFAALNPFIEKNKF